VFRCVSLCLCFEFYETGFLCDTRPYCQHYTFGCGTTNIEHTLHMIATVSEARISTCSLQALIVFVSGRRDLRALSLSCSHIYSTLVYLLYATNNRLLTRVIFHIWIVEIVVYCVAHAKSIDSTVEQSQPTFESSLPRWIHTWRQ
jgi:hypothetical protein